MDPADVHDIVAQLHRGRSEPFGSCQCLSCQTARDSRQPVIGALVVGLQMAAAQKRDFTIASEYVPLVLAALLEKPPATPNMQMGRWGRSTDG